MKELFSFIGGLLVTAVIIVILVAVAYIAYEMFFACDFSFGGACIRF